MRKFAAAVVAADSAVEGSTLDVFRLEVNFHQQVGRRGELLLAAGADSPHQPLADDAFDRWNASRVQETGKQLAEAEAYLPEELDDFEHELGEYGEWVFLPPYGNVWVPGGVDDAWRPYWNGRWVWLSLTGWTWLPYDPWGWVTFHYGRWHWGVGVGWYWIPMNVWGPGWVNWWWDYHYFGWAPMSYWGYPGILMGGRSLNPIIEHRMT